MNMAKSETRPFFLRLGTLCRYVDSQVMGLKEELVTHDLKPHNYDRGLKCLKNDVKDLKKLTKDLQPKLASIENFSSYLQSMQELVTQQATDIEKIEKYLLTFGYTPLPKQEKNAKNCEVTVEVAGPPSEQKECGSPDRPPQEEDNAKPKGTPVLSNVGLMVVQGKAIPTVAAPKPVQAPSKAHLETPITSKVQSKYEEETKGVCSLSSLSHSYMTVDQWLAGVSEPVELTPDVLPAHRTSMRKRLPQRIQSEERDLHLVETPPRRQENPTSARVTQRMEAPRPVTPPASQRKDTSEVACSAPATPSEPQLSEYTTSLLSLINRKPIQAYEEPQVPHARQLHAATPEEPGLSTFTTESSREEKKAERVYTPEEPALSYSEKKLAFVKNFNKENYTPEEPALSYKKPQSENHIDERTPEEPFLSSAHSKSHPQGMSSFPCPKKSYVTSPSSPQLSDITRSVLTYVQNPVPTHSSRRQTEQHYSYRNPTEPRKSEMPHLPSYHRSSSHPYNSEPGSFSRSMMDTLGYQATFSEPTSSRDEAQKGAETARHRPRMAVEEFLKQDDVPASPQLSDVTQRIFGQTKRW